MLEVFSHNVMTYGSIYIKVELGILNAAYNKIQNMCIDVHVKANTLFESVARELRVSWKQSVMRI